METFNKYYKQVGRIYKEELTINQYFELLKTIEDGEDEIKAELKSKTVKVLKSVCAQLGNWTDNRDKKQDLINKAYSSLKDYFLIGWYYCAFVLVRLVMYSPGLMPDIFRNI